MAIIPFRGLGGLLYMKLQKRAVHASAEPCLPPAPGSNAPRQVSDLHIKGLVVTRKISSSLGDQADTSITA